MQVNKIDKKTWQTFLDDCPAATFFHTPDWYRVWKKYADYDYEARLLILENGKKALLPIAWRMRLKGLIREYFSGPVGTYGGVLMIDEWSPQEVQVLEQYLKKISWLEIRSNPLQSGLSTSFFTKKDITQILDLKQGWASIFKQWSKGHASAAKKGLREGVKIRLAKKDQWRDYHQIYLDTFNRWERPPDSKYSFELFELLSNLNQKNCKLWLATIDEQIIAGALCFYFQKHVVYWHGASLEKYFSYKPVHVLQYHIIRDALEQKYDWYDFNPSGGLSGVRKFKKGFGTKAVPAPVYSRQPYFIKKLFGS